jgi:NADP-dependent 3-hydroxy acid dehydrogenase YdfG
MIMVRILFSHLRRIVVIVKAIGVRAGRSHGPTIFVYVALCAIVRLFDIGLRQSVCKKAVAAIATAPTELNCILVS